MNEIEEFLKRAAAMRARQQQMQPAPPRPAPPRPAPPSPTQVTLQRTAPLAPLARQFRTEVIEDAEVIEVEEVTGDDVAQYVSHHLDTGSFAERTSHLAESIKGSDEVIEAHLHQTFEHRLGQLGATTARADDSSLDAEEAAANALKNPSVAALDLRALLKSPQSLRNAIILSEVLNPPHRFW